MHFEQRLEFIDSLPELKIITPQVTTFSTVSATPTTLPEHNIDKPTASVMPDDINVFLPGASEENINDANLCKLVMQNAATKAYPDDSQLFEWYKYYVNGLGRLGWVTQNWDLRETTIKRTGLTMDQVAVELAAGLIGANAAAILANVAQKAVGLAQNNLEAIRIFEHNKKLGKQAKFDISPVWIDNNKQPNMILNCISLDARESSRGILFWKSTSQSTDVKTGAVRSYLDNKVFSRLRETLYDKYYENGKKYIMDMPDFD
jgi:hypothetical protein